MNGPHFAASLALALAVIAADGDRPRPPGRLAAGFAAEQLISVVPMNRFYIMGWLSPPAESTSAVRIAELSGAGMNLALQAIADSGRVEDNLRRLDLAAAHGMQCMIWDSRFQRFDPDDPQDGALVDSIVADYRSHPAFFGYYMGDEPPRSVFEGAVKFFAPIRARDPEHPPYNNLLGRAGFKTRDEWLDYTRDYLSRVHPAVLCNDQYDFMRIGDRGQFVENAAGLNALAREAGIPFWSFILLIEHGVYRRVTTGELEWQIGTLLAYGARGIGYFTYWTPGPDTVWNWRPAIIDHDGQRTDWYPVVARLNRLARAAGDTLASLAWLATVQAGSVSPGGTRFTPNGWVSDVDGRAMLGHFVDSIGVRYLMVVNSDSLARRTITLTLVDVTRACVLDERADSWSAVECRPLDPGSRLALDLDAGGFALVRLEGGLAGVVVGGVAPRIQVMPNPAAGEVRLAAAGLSLGGHLEILDSAGRRVWSRRLGPGNATLAWRGERDSGERVAPGLYFARLEDERGVRVARITWLGAR